MSNAKLDSEHHWNIKKVYSKLVNYLAKIRQLRGTEKTPEFFVLQIEREMEQIRKHIIFMHYWLRQFRHFLDYGDTQHKYDDEEKDERFRP